MKTELEVASMHLQLVKLTPEQEHRRQIKSEIERCQRLAKGARDKAVELKARAKMLNSVAHHFHETAAWLQNTEWLQAKDSR